MKKRLLFILTIFALNSFIGCGIENIDIKDLSEINDEIIDQCSPLGYNNFACGAYNTYIAQSFKPKLSITIESF